jgi:Family of unknown function (DUF6152)
MNFDDAIKRVRELPQKRDVPVSDMDAIRQALSLDGRCFFRPQRQQSDFHGVVVRRAQSWEDREKPMRQQLVVLASCAFVATSGTVLAHHSFAMFDQENPIELEGLVQEFKFTSPHTFIFLTVNQEDGTTQVWSLEGAAPSALVRDGWSSKTLKPGDELKLTVEPLRSGAPGGAWTVSKTKFKDGRPIVVSH